MIALVMAITVALSILLSSFISFTPNLQRLMERDFMERANSNAFLYSLQMGQLAERADTIDTDPATPVTDTTQIDTDIRIKDGIILNRIHSDITLDASGRINVRLQVLNIGEFEP